MPRTLVSRRVNPILSRLDKKQEKSAFSLSIDSRRTSSVVNRSFFETRCRRLRLRLRLRCSRLDGRASIYMCSIE